MNIERQAQLLVIAGPENGKSISLVEGNRLFIGRSKENQLIVGEKKLSRQHAWIGE